MRKHLGFMVIFIAISSLSIGQVHHQWTKGIIGMDFLNRPMDIKCDTSDNVIMVGFGKDNTNTNMFVAKMETDGTLMWHHWIGGVGTSEVANAVCIDDSNNVYITGYFTGTVNFESYAGKSRILESNGGYDVFVLKFSPEGTMQWANSFGSLADDKGMDVELNREMEKVYMVGYRIEPGGADTNGIFGVFNALNGEFLSSELIDGNGAKMLTQIERLNNGELYVGGMFSKSIGGRESLRGIDAFTATINEQNLQLGIENLIYNNWDQYLVDLASNANKYFLLLGEVPSDSPPFNHFFIYLADEYGDFSFKSSSGVQSIAGSGDFIYGSGKFVDDFKVRANSYIANGPNLFLLKNSLKNYDVGYVYSFAVKDSILTGNTVMAVNSKEEIIMCGTFIDTLNFGDDPGTALPSVSVIDLFVSKFTTENSTAQVEELIPVGIDDYHVSFDEITFTYLVSVPLNTDLKNLTLQISISDGASITPLPSTVKDYSSRVEFIVTSEDGHAVNKFNIDVAATIPAGTKDDVINEHQVMIYPNPVGEVLYFRLPDYTGKIHHLGISGIDAKQYIAPNFNGATSSISVGELQKGMYFLSITINDRHFNIPFIKE